MYQKYDEKSTQSEDWSSNNNKFGQVFWKG